MICILFVNIIPIRVIRVAYLGPKLFYALRGAAKAASVRRRSPNGAIPIGRFPSRDSMMVRMPVYVSLGSNVGDRFANLRSAVEALRTEDGIEVLRESQVYETDPVGDIEQPPFLNMALSIETTLEPLELLDRTQAIEQRLGRVATRRWGPRVIDIDIILWGDMAITSDRLTIPHPEFRNRAFVLIPLAEIASGSTDPVTGSNVGELAGACTGREGVRLFA